MRYSIAARVSFVSVAVAAFTLAIPVASAAQSLCTALPPPTGRVIEVTPLQAANLPSIVQSAATGDTIQLADGTYQLPQTLVFRSPGVTLRSKSGNDAAVILDGRYAVGDLLLITESNVTIADLTVTRAYFHPIHVAPETHSTTGTLVHHVRVIDGAQQFIKINPNNGYYADQGVVRCSWLQLTDAGRTQVRDNCYTGGVDGHQAAGWQIYENVFSGFWCSAGLSEHAIHFWTGSRDTVVDRNLIVNAARAIGFGMGENWPVYRTYADQPCGGRTGLGHYGGAITNSFIYANDPRLFASAAGFDAGIGLEQSCATAVLHNTVFSTAPPFSSIEWRWSQTTATIANNIVSHNLRPRDGAFAALAGNITSAPASLFVDASTGDLHLRPTATAAIDKAVALNPALAWDIDSAPRGTLPDVGADEFAGWTFTLTVPATALAGTSIEVRWSGPAGQVTGDDWIGLFASGAADSTPSDVRYTGGAAAGTTSFNAPGVAGRYEFRYFNGNTAVPVTTSSPIDVTVPTIPAPPPPVDTVAPTVSITSPANGQTVRKQIEGQGGGSRQRRRHAGRVVCRWRADDDIDDAAVYLAMEYKQRQARHPRPATQGV
jgi:hypothetical protein